MAGEPREGVDWIADLYAVAQVATDADEQLIKDAINARLKQNHPDRYEGLEPRLASQAARTTLYLNRARNILLDPEKRAEYDQIMAEWDGPISRDGNPVIKLDRAMEAEIAQLIATQGLDGLNAKLEQSDREVDALVGFSPERAKTAEMMLEYAGADVPAELRERLKRELDEALAHQDEALMSKEADRLAILGATDALKVAGDGEHALAIAAVIAEHKTKYQERQEQIALGGFGTRLALLSGEMTQEQAAEISERGRDEYPEYFTVVGEQAVSIAKQRDQITEKRLDNFESTYPEADLQTEPRQQCVIGVEGMDRWMIATIDAEASNVSVGFADSKLTALLETADIKSIIASGINVMKIKQLKNIDLSVLVEIAITKYCEKYGIEIGGDEEEEV